MEQATKSKSGAILTSILIGVVVTTISMVIFTKVIAPMFKSKNDNDLTKAGS